MRVEGCMLPARGGVGYCFSACITIESKHPEQPVLEVSIWFFDRRVPDEVKNLFGDFLLQRLNTIVKPGLTYPSARTATQTEQTRSRYSLARTEAASQQQN